jgi:hypothetical protein
MGRNEDDRRERMRGDKKERKEASMWERNGRRQVGKEWQATSGREKGRQAGTRKEATCRKGKGGGMCERNGSCQTEMIG